MSYVVHLNTTLLNVVRAQADEKSVASLLATVSWLANTRSSKVLVNAPNDGHVASEQLQDLHGGRVRSRNQRPSA